MSCYALKFIYLAPVVNRIRVGIKPTHTRWLSKPSKLAKRIQFTKRTLKSSRKSKLSINLVFGIGNVRLAVL